MTKPIGLAAAVRTPFTRVDGGLARPNAVASTGADGRVGAVAQLER